MFFFLFLVVFNNFFTIPVVIENARLQLALIIPTGAPIIVANDAHTKNNNKKKCYQLLQTKKLMTYQNSQKKQYIYSITLLPISPLSLISAIK